MIRVLFLLLASTSCAPAVSYVRLGTPGPARGLADPIVIHMDDREIPRGSVVIGELRIGDTGFSVGCGLDRGIATVKDRARGAGADAAYIVSIQEPDFSSTCYRLTARFLRYPSTTSAAESARATEHDSVSWTRPLPAASSVISLRATDENHGSEVANVFERIADGIITIQHSSGSGSGLIIARDGLALTNAHVIAGSRGLYAVLSNGQRVPARVLRADDESDVALLQIVCPGDCRTLQLAERDPAIGTEVIAVGSPMGLQQTFTRGIVSAIRRSGTLSLIQTDAAVNRGNSGGPIVDRESGRALGIVSWKFTGSGVEGVAFAVSIPDALRILGVEPAP